MRILVAFKNHLDPYVPTNSDDDEIRDFLATTARIEYYEQVKKGKTQFIVHSLNFPQNDAKGSSDKTLDDSVGQDDQNDDQDQDANDDQDNNREQYGKADQDVLNTSNENTEAIEVGSTSKTNKNNKRFKKPNTTTDVKKLRNF